MTKSTEHEIDWDYHISSYFFGDDRSGPSYEQLYQAFKSRLLKEISKCIEGDDES